MRSVVRTDRGKVRAHNEDYAGVSVYHADVLLAVVCDGMGGHAAGDVASRMAGELLQKAWEEADAITTSGEAEQWFRTNIQKVNDQIFSLSSRDESLKGMGTTIVSAICTEKFATIANVGDSRCYIINPDGLKQITDDHSLVNELVKIGELTKEDAENHPRKNVLLRALGTELSVEVDTLTIPFEKNDYLLLCSDGLTNQLSDEEIEKIIRSDHGLEEKADQMVDLANQYGGDDNISLILIHNAAGEKAGEE